MKISYKIISTYIKFDWLLNLFIVYFRLGKFIFLTYEIQFHLSETIFGFFRRTKGGIQTPPPSEVVRFLWKMRNVLKRMKNDINFFSNFYFSSYGWKFIKNWGNFEYKYDLNSKNKNLTFGFSFYSADSRCFI